MSVAVHAQLSAEIDLEFPCFSTELIHIFTQLSWRKQTISTAAHFKPREKKIVIIWARTLNSTAQSCYVYITPIIHIYIQSLDKS